MDVNTIEILKECSSGCKMAIDSIEQVKEYVHDEKLNRLLVSYNEQHEKLLEKIRKLLAQYGKDDEDPSMMAEWCAKMKIEMKMTMHPDDHQIAKLMMDGCNMGIQSVSEYVNKYPDASPEAQDVAKELIKAEEDFMVEMKEFV
ncbi:MAG: PA2169 family four-helix-bundle protein [Lachnospiraceae bacterium]|nr:PA2169 family four-helix-bundle protein [Lachnospiraceae bacterium]